MKLTMLLADSAQAVNNKLFILGGGWSVTGPAPTLSAIALKLDVPWDETNRKHRFKLTLVTSDGAAVQVPTPTGDRDMEIAGEFEVGRPPGLAPGTPIDVALAINLGPIQLTPGQRYEWRCHIDGQTKDEWSLPFSVRSAEQAPQQ